MSLVKRGKTWHIVIHHQGERIRETTWTADRREAQRIHDELAARLWSRPKTGGERTWQDACVAWLKAAERSQSDRYTLRALDYPDRPLTQCTADSFVAALDGKTPATYNRHRALIVAILRLAGLDFKMPTRKVKTGRLRFLTADEWQRLHAALPDYLKPIAAFAITTGLRQQNVTHLRWDDLDLKRAVMWVHPDMAKAGKPIGIALSPDAVAILRRQLAVRDDDADGQPCPWVFPYKGRGRAAGKPVAKIKTAWQLAMEKAGLGHFERWESADGKKHKKWIGDFTFHGLRHTWASWHIMAGTPLEVLKELGAWNDLRMVQRYAHLAPEHLAGYAGNAVPWKPEHQAKAAA